MEVSPRDAKISERAAAFMHSRTIAFWGHHDQYTRGEPKQYGSGVLLQIDDVRFILTAEHITQLFLKHGLPLVVAAQTERPTQIAAAHVRRIESENADIAIIVLKPEDAEHIAKEKMFTRLPECVCDDPTTEVGGLYCAFGYPSKQSSIDHDARLMTMIGPAR